MEHLTALLIKTVMIAAVLVILAPFAGAATLGGNMLLALLLAGSAYLIGDLWILPTGGNMTAAIADFFLAAATIWLVSAAMVTVDYGFMGAALLGAVIAVGEYLFFHRYLTGRVVGAGRDTGDAGGRRGEGAS